MSNKRTKTIVALTNAVSVEGHYLVVASDGTVRLVNSSTKKGEDLDGFDIALTTKASRTVVRAAKLLEEVDKITTKLQSMELPEIDTGDLGSLHFTDDSGSTAVRIGCTSIYPNELKGYLKQLGIKAS